MATLSLGSNLNLLFNMEVVSLELYVQLYCGVIL
jgi:hypothetical protein